MFTKKLSAAISFAALTAVIAAYPGYMAQSSASQQNAVTVEKAYEAYEEREARNLQKYLEDRQTRKQERLKDGNNDRDETYGHDDDERQGNSDS